MDHRDPVDVAGHHQTAAEQSARRGDARLLAELAKLEARVRALEIVVATLVEHEHD